MSYPYPTEVPFTSVLKIVDLVRTGKTASEFPSFANAAWEVQGYAQYMAFGHGSESTLYAQALDTVDLNEKIDDNEMLECLERLNPNIIAAQSLIPWETIIVWLAKKLLEAIISYYARKLTTDTHDKEAVVKKVE